MKTYSVKITLIDGRIAYLSHLNKTAWTWKFAKRHLETMEMDGVLKSELEEN